MDEEIEKSIFETKLVKCMSVVGNNSSSICTWVDVDRNIYKSRLYMLQNVKTSLLINKWWFIEFRIDGDVWLTNDYVEPPIETLKMLLI